MLEGLVAGLLNRFPAWHVKNFDPAQLKVGIWSGDVKLRNLELRREALDQLKLPINVVEGHLGELTLIIPWSNLRGAPVKVFIEDVYLLASPKEEAQYNEEEEERRRQRLKMEKLDSAELLKERSREGLSREEEKRSQSFTQSLVTKIVDNLQVTIQEHPRAVRGRHIRPGTSLRPRRSPWRNSVRSAPTASGSPLSSRTPRRRHTSSPRWKPWPSTGTPTPSCSARGGSTLDEAMMPHDELVGKFKSMIGKTEAEAVVGHQFILQARDGAGQDRARQDRRCSRAPVQGDPPVR